MLSNPFISAAFPTSIQNAQNQKHYQQKNSVKCLLTMLNVCNNARFKDCNDISNIYNE